MAGSDFSIRSCDSESDLKSFNAIGNRMHDPHVWLLIHYGWSCSDHSRKTGSSPKGKETTGTGISKAESAAAAAVATASRDRQVHNFGSAVCGVEHFVWH
jgi:hypothetical protein